LLKAFRRPAVCCEMITRTDAADGRGAGHLPPGGPMATKGEGRYVRALKAAAQAKRGQS